jgi:hypothetical protein
MSASNQDHMKFEKLNPLLFILGMPVLGFLVAAFFPALLESFLDLSQFVSTPWESILSAVLLFGLCWLSTRIILWAYSRIQAPQHPIRVLAVGLALTVASAVLYIWLGYLNYQRMLDILREQRPNLSFSGEYANFLVLGFKPVLLTCLIITILLLWIARGRRSTKLSEDSTHMNKSQDIILVLSTLIVLYFSINIAIDFVRTLMIIWLFGQG